MSHSLNSLRGGGLYRDYIGDYYIVVIKGDTRSLDFCSKFRQKIQIQLVCSIEATSPDSAF